MRNELSRRRFIALAGGSAAAASVLAACGSDSSGSDSSDETAQFGKGDLGILNYALTLEYVEAAFYAKLAERKLLTGTAGDTLAKFREDEQEHLAALIEEIGKRGGKPAALPQTTFSFKTESEALETASELENLGAAAYLGQLPSIQSESALKAVLSIHSVEGRHAAALNDLTGKPQTPDGAFAKPATVAAVMEAIDPYLSSGQKKADG